VRARLNASTDVQVAQILDADEGDEGEEAKREDLAQVVQEVQEFACIIFKAIDKGLDDLLNQGGPCNEGAIRPEFVVAFEQGLATSTVHHAATDLRKVIERIFLLRVQQKAGCAVDLRFLGGK